MSAKDIKTPPVDMDYIRLRCDVDECWEWRMACRKDRGPVASFQRDDGSGKSVRLQVFVRHLVYWIVHGIRPRLGRSRVLRVSCNNPLCVSPDHIKVVQRKGLMKGIPKAGTHGAKIAHARRKSSKLSDENIALIRESDMSAQEASMLFGVTDKYIYQIRRGEWRRDYSNPFAGLGA